MMRTTLFLLVLWTTVCYGQIYDTLTGNSSNSRSKRASDDYYYYGEEEEEAESRYLLFSVVMIVSIVFIVIEILVTLYGPGMPDHPLRWHTLNYCCWNCFQLIIFANCADESSFKDFLFNKYISKNCNEIQRMTLSVYYHSMFFVTPAMWFRYFVPSSKRSPLMKYYFWIPLLFGLDLALFLSYSSQPWAWYFEGVVPIAAYQAGITLINYGFLIMMFVAVVGSIIQYAYYWCQYSARPEGQTYKRFISLINFILFYAYYITITVFHSPHNGVCMGSFLSPYILEYITPYLDLLLPIITTMLTIQQFFALLVPISEFFATFLFLKMYRNQLLQCLSCGQHRHKPPTLSRITLPYSLNKKLPKFQSINTPERPTTPEIKMAAGYFTSDVVPFNATPNPA